MRARYITTTLPYVNADAHVGHALEFVQADCYKRTLVASGEAVFLNTGTDEHGAKIAAKAEERGQTPEAYADEYADRFKEFCAILDVAYDAFTRTTSDTHREAAQEFWRRCEANGDIYKATYELKYCVGCELEKTDSELVDGRCPLHPNVDVEIRTEENYYFRFSKYQEPLLALYREHPAFVVPSVRAHEIATFVAAGLKDFSISRRKEKLSWGIPVPGDDDHVMYVWFDALVNYISAIGWPHDEARFQQWWPVIQFAGKDNLRQQSAMWQAMLLSAGLEPSKQIFIHGFITSGGQKMSKSLGNVIDPRELVAKYGTDAVRYILLRHAHPFEDSDLTAESIHTLYTAHLTNGLGNLVSRVMKLAEANLYSPVMVEETPLPKEFVSLIEQFEFNRAHDLIWDLIQQVDLRITRDEPFRVVKEDPERGRAMITELVRDIARIGALLAPSMPRTSAAIEDAVAENKKPENLFPRL
jgi:methionyl-tRNA synthetase